MDDIPDPHTPGLGLPRFGIIVSEPPDEPGADFSLSLANFSSDSLDIRSPPTKSPGFGHYRRSSFGSPLAGRQMRPLLAVFDSDDVARAMAAANISNVPRLRSSWGIMQKTNNYTPKEGPPKSLNKTPKEGHLLGPPRPHQDSPSKRLPRSRPVLFIAPPDSPMVPEDEVLELAPANPSPFNFTSQNLSNTNLLVKPAHRRGHKYKHSSVSMNLFQEPPAATISVSDPIPERQPLPLQLAVVSSITDAQKFKLVWLSLHLATAAIVFIAGSYWNLLVLLTLSHLVFYDALGLVLVVGVDVMLNFDVWNLLLLAYPFGLGRLEVLVGFALSSLLVMVGFDLVSHFIEGAIIEMLGLDQPHDHLGHHVHDNGVVTNWVGYELLLVATVVVTVLTTFFVRTTRIISDDVLNPEQDSLVHSWPEHFRRWTRNPTHIITLSYCAYLMIGPLVGPVADIHELVSLCVALMLCNTGWRLVKRLGLILLCAFPTTTYSYDKMKSSLTQEIVELDFFKHQWQVVNLFITKFNYDTVVVGMKIDMKGATSDDDLRVRFEVNRIVKRKLTMADDASKIEITVEIDRL